VGEGGTMFGRCEKNLRDLRRNATLVVQRAVMRSLGVFSDSVVSLSPLRSQRWVAVE